MAQRRVSTLLWLVALVALANDALVSVEAADCTSAQIAELTALTSNVTVACGSDALSSTTTTSEICNDSTCLAFVTSMLASVPSCEVSSYNLRSVLTTAINSCDAQSDAVPATKSPARSLVHGASAQDWPALLLRFLQLAVLVGLALAQ